MTWCSALFNPDSSDSSSKVLGTCSLPSCPDSDPRTHSWSKEDLFPLAEEQAGSYLYAECSQEWRLETSSPVRAQYSISHSEGCSSGMQYTLPAALSSLSALDQVLLGIRSTLVARSLAPKRVPGCGSFVVPQVRSIARAVTWQESLQATSHLERKYTFEFALLLGTLCFYAG